MRYIGLCGTTTENSLAFPRNFRGKLRVVDGWPPSACFARIAASSAIHLNPAAKPRRAVAVLWCATPLPRLRVLILSFFPLHGFVNEGVPRRKKGR